ncbi:hypothetical protein Tco_0097064, partial [Tanacetum coccineum]
CMGLSSDVGSYFLILIVGIQRLLSAFEVAAALAQA